MFRLRVWDINSTTMQEMGDLHSMAYHYGNSLNQQHSSNSLCWDPHNFGVFNGDHSSSLLMDRNPPVFSSDFDSDLSTGYLQDALVEFHDRSKRRRVFLYSEDQTKSFNFHVHSYWNSNITWDLYENLNCLSQLTANIDHKVSDDPISTSVNRVSEETNIFTVMNTLEEEISAHEEALYSSSPDSYKDNSVNYTMSSPSGSDNEKIKKKKKKNRVNNMSRMVYPFELVKPGGVEGDMTLNDINERILMPSTRPVRHPVGDFACRPSVSANGPGLSGKAVVALTRIHTQGRGTITIIRTKG